MSKSILVPIKDLPEEVSYTQAILGAYGEEVDEIVNLIDQGLNVLVKMPKGMWNHAYKVIRKQYKKNTKSEEKKTFELIAGSNAGPDESILTSILQGFKEHVQSGGSGVEDSVLVLPHLDVLTTTTQSSLTTESREMLVSSYQNSKITMVAFCDPKFALPAVLEDIFDKTVSLVGIPRDHIKNLVAQREARKFSLENWNPYDLHKVVSGMNPVSFRKMMESFSDYEDFNPVNAGTVDRLFKDIRSRTTTAGCEVPKVSLMNDVGGYDEVKETFREEILGLLEHKDSLEDPDEINRIESLIPKGMLLYGPPGTGKTFFAKALATSLNASIQIVNGPELKSKWVGESEANLRRVFETARKNAPAIIVFDEIDSFAGQRGTHSASGVGHSMVNQLLTEMDGFRKDELVFVVGTSNFLDSVDSALLRPGRFELKVHIDYPDECDRGEIIDIYAEKFKLPFSDKMREYLVDKTAGFYDMRRGMRFTGDNINAIMKNIERQRIRNHGELEIDKSVIDKALTGPNKKKRAPFTSRELRVVTIHEVGHAVVGHMCPHADATEKISTKSDISGALGYVQREESEDQYIMTKNRMLDQICVLMGGREAEDLFIGDICTGAIDDLEKATGIAKSMVEQYGMSDLGSRVTVGRNRYGQDLSDKGMADATIEKVDNEIKKILDAQRERARGILEENKHLVKKFVKVLREKRILDKDEIIEILGPPVRATDNADDEEWIK